MDFHTMVSSFKRTLLEEKEQVSELSKNARKIVRKYIADGTPDRHTPKYSFKELFRDVPNFDRLGKAGPMRTMFPMGNTVQRGGTELFKRLVDQGWEPAFTTKTVIQKNKDADGREYDVPMDLPELTLKKEEEKSSQEEKDSFDLFYSVYPRKQGKAGAWKHWKNNYSKLPISTIMDHCQKAYVNTEKGWIPHADTYLNQEKYYDEIVAAVKKVDPIRISEFKKTTTGHLIGYCHECDESSQFYKDKFDIQKGTHCKCNSTVYPIPKGGLNGSSIGNNR